MDAAINKEEKFQKQFRYHHGNLRETLVEAALDILANEGLGSLSLRAIARKSNVSQAAPYSHFRNKKELLSTVAEAGFQKMALKMADEASGADSTQARINKLILSYINFAKDNKALFQIMFSKELSDMKGNATLAMTAGKSYSLISAALSKRENNLNADTGFLTVAIWSLCHGLANLIIDEKLDVAKFGARDLDDFVARTVSIFKSNF